MSSRITSQIKLLARDQDKAFKKLISLPTLDQPPSSSESIMNCEVNVTSLHSAVSKLKGTLAKAINDSIAVVTGLDINIVSAHSSIDSFGDWNEGGPFI